MIAIETRYIPATNTKPSRIKAYTSNPGQHVTMSVSAAEEESKRSAGDEDCHRIVAQALADKMQWGPLSKDCGGTKRGYAFVFPNKY